MMIIGCDFHPSWQQVSWLDTETGECGAQKLVHATGVPRCFISNWRGGADRHGSDRQQSVVHRTGAGLGTRNLGWGCGADPGQLRAQAEDGQKGRGSYSETGGGRAVFEVVGPCPGET